MPKYLFNELNAKWVSDKKLKELVKIYRNSRQRLIAMLKDVDSLTEYKTARINSLLSQVNEEIKYLNKKAIKWSEGVLKSRYRDGISLARKDLINLNVTRSVNFDAQIHKQAVAVIVDSTINDLLFANDSILKNITRYIRQTQQTILTEQTLNRKIAQGLIEGETRRKVSDTLLKEFKSRMSSGEFITINGRNYDPKKYTDLLGRTRIREATSRGSLNTAIQYNMDLVQIDVHSDACPICVQFMGRVYSISGNDPDFPALEFLPPYHPNCECNPHPVNRESLEARGNYNELVKLSNNPKRPFLDLKGAKNWVKNNKQDAISSFAQFKARSQGKYYTFQKNKQLHPSKTLRKPKTITPTSAVGKKSWQNLLTEKELEKELELRNYLSSTRDIIPKSYKLQEQRLIDNWTRGSKRKVSVEMKEAAIKEFDLNSIAYSSVDYNFDINNINTTRGTLRTMYNNTQGEFKSKGIEKVTLYRGVKKTYKLAGSLESWTDNLDVAKKFDGADIIKQEFNVDDILISYKNSEWRNGMWGQQYEYVVIRR